MEELMVKFHNTTVYERQLKFVESQVKHLFGDNRSKWMRDLLDSDELKVYFKRKWREAREQHPELVEGEK